MDFSSNIKYLRKLKKLNQEDLGVKLGVSNTTISNWEKEVATPDLNTALLISNFFGISVNDLFSKDLTKIDTSDIESRNLADYISKNQCDLCNQKDQTIIALKEGNAALKEMAEYYKMKNLEVDHVKPAKKSPYQQTG
jgi:DNA-binding XRE family transcriptional regulator